MTKRTLAIVEPGGLVAKELRERLERRPELWRELRLLAASDEEVGTLTDLAGGAAMVRRLDAEAMQGVDLVFLAGPAAAARQSLATLPPGCRAVVLSPDATAQDGPLLVSGVNLPAALEATVAVSPHPGAVMLAHLLQPLLGHGLRRAVATLLQPVSVFGPDALDQLFGQARSLLTFQPVEEATHWERQLAFNLQAAPPGDEIAAQVREVLATGAEVTVQVLQTGVFHGLAASVNLSFASDPDPVALREVLAQPPWTRWADQDPLGPVDAASAEELLLGHLRRDQAAGGSYWLWAVMDNLTRTASNALAIAEAMLA